MVVHETGDSLGVEAGILPLQVALEGLAAHERHHWPGGVVGAGVVAAGDQFLEHLAQHLRVDGHLDVEGRGLHHREVESFEQAGQNLPDGLVGHG